MELSQFFQNLPSDILQQILVYDGTIKRRNGKYMDQLSKTDARYDLLQSIPKAVALFNNDMFFCFIVHFTNCKHTLVIKNVNKFHRIDEITYNLWSSDPLPTKRIRSYHVYTRY